MRSAIRRFDPGPVGRNAKTEFSHEKQSALWGATGPVSDQAFGEPASFDGGPELTVIVPCFNEEPVIEETHRQLTEFFQKQLPIPYEIIYVNDGSRDRTLEILRDIASRDPNVRVLAFARNFGHQMAVTAGIDAASGKAAVLIDADLQDPPEAIRDMYKRWKEGYHVAYGQRTEREGESAFKLLTAKIFYRLINRLSDVDIPVDTGDFRLMDRKVIEAIKDMPEQDRFLRGMISWVGFKQIAVPYRRAARFAGESKYPFFKMLRFAIDGIVSFSSTPLRMVMWIGIYTVLFSFIGIAYALILRLFTTNFVQGWTLLFIAMLFLGGVQMISLGIIGEYVGRVYREVKGRPLYLVNERIGFRNKARKAVKSRDGVGSP